jgi:hypothetical protein
VTPAIDVPAIAGTLHCCYEILYNGMEATLALEALPRKKKVG